MNLARLGFFVSIFSYLFFLLLEYVRPGFVSNYLSVHIFLLFAIIFGIFWARQKHVGDAAIIPNFFVATFSVLLAIFTWREGRAFEDYRVLVTAVAFVVPFLVWRNLIRNR